MLKLEIKLRLLPALLTGCGVFLLVVPSEADRIFKDSFNYSNGDFNGLSTNGQVPWSVVQPVPFFTTVVRPGLEYPGYPSSGGAGRMLKGIGGGAIMASPALTAIRDNPGTFYAAVLMKGEMDWWANATSFIVAHRIPIDGDLVNHEDPNAPPLPYTGLIHPNIIFGNTADTVSELPPCSIGENNGFCDSGVRTDSGPDGTDLVVLEITSFTGDTVEEKLDEVRWAVNPDLWAGPTALQEAFDATGVTKEGGFDPNAAQLWNGTMWEHCPDCVLPGGDSHGIAHVAFQFTRRANSRFFLPDGTEVFGDPVDDGFFDEVQYATTMDELFGWHVWGESTGGDWNTSTNWRNGLVPNGDANNTNVVAIFDRSITEAQTISLESAVTVKQVQFHNENTYTVAGSGAINLVGSTGVQEPTATVHASQGKHIFSVPVNTQTLTDVMVGPGATLNFDGPLGLMGNTVTKMGAGTMNVNDNNTGSGRLVVAEGTLGGNGTVGGDVEVAAWGRVPVPEA